MFFFLLFCYDKQNSPFRVLLLVILHSILLSLLFILFLLPGHASNKQKKRIFFAALTEISEPTFFSCFHLVSQNNHCNPLIRFAFLCVLFHSENAFYLSSSLNRVLFSISGNFVFIRLHSRTARDKLSFPFCYIEDDEKVSFFLDFSTPKASNFPLSLHLTCWKIVSMTKAMECDCGKTMQHRQTTMHFLLHFKFQENSPRLTPATSLVKI
jgi:hypothetical protein